MLSRIAESLFWIGRYVERADDTARILDAFLAGILDDPRVDEDSACRSLLAILGTRPGTDARLATGDVLEAMAFDAPSPVRSPARWPPPGRTPAGRGRPSPARCGNAST
jgi:uncharacterized alpha-E superfamily protein